MVCSSLTFAGVLYPCAPFRQSQEYLPADPAVVASYLAAHAEALSVATLVRRLATISKVHEARGLSNPCRSEIVRATLWGLKRAADFQNLGVLEARPDATPNFVLQTNPNYHAIWDAWHELLKRREVLDELWRWQTRSWEEFCAVALMVALQSIEGAEVIATSPIVFRDEQQRGRWVDTINPLGVVHLNAQELIVEVQYVWRTDNFANFCAPIWLRVGRIGASSRQARARGVVSHRFHQFLRRTVVHRVVLTFVVKPSTPIRSPCCAPAPPEPSRTSGKP
jgi:hypothetical protein